ncbi:MAG: hypothetical protein A2W93_08685 [Bacteroidetes bacterium GWF2_43_63]|nr:MAG: hypothetical protein A2W94_03110 [Bacteroidetes bacterium GWE2_42_42]OFY55207.1 MAG: hypothetical protein A2W93_08685 [Bacteroidetes bacterium GWF2_43_63]
MSIRKALILLLIPVVFSSCAGLREHIRERQLETHGPPKNIRDNRNDLTERKDKTRRDTLSNISERNAPTGVYAKYGEKWKVELSGTEDAKFLEEIDSWLGTPYVYGGECKKGTDCSGMILAMYETIYNLALNRSANDMQKDVRFIDIDKAQLGDVLFFKINGDRVSHVGLYLGSRRFIHATTSKGVMISSLDEDYYSKRYYKCGRIVAMERQ